MQLVTRKLDSIIEPPELLKKMLGLSIEPIHAIEWTFTLNDMEMSELISDLVGSMNVPLPTAFVMMVLFEPCTTEAQQARHDEMVQALVKAKPLLAMLITEKIKIDKHNLREVKS